MREFWVRVAALGLFSVVALCSVGCARVKNKIVDVKGKIAFQDGKPLPNGTRLIFTPTGGGAAGAFGIADDGGSFEVEHVTGRTGAELGKYTVLLAAPEGDTESFFQLVPNEYRDGGVLMVEVKDGMAPLDLKVKRKTPTKKA